MATAAAQAPEILRPTSAQEAVASFGDGDGVTVLAGGTILMVELTHQRLPVERVLMLDAAGLSGVRRDGPHTTIGAMTPVAELQDAAEPLGTSARGVADPEIRAQGTLGGNLCAGPAAQSPRGDLQGALIALGARVRWVGGGGERSEPVEDFLQESAARRLVLDVSFGAPTAAASASVRRPHAHAYTILAVSGAQTSEGLRLGVCGAGPRAVRLRAVERAVAEGAAVREAAARALDDVSPAGDALASAWYREQTLPVLVGRVLNELQ